MIWRAVLRAFASECQSGRHWAQMSNRYLLSTSYLISSAVQSWRGSWSRKPRSWTRVGRRSICYHWLALVTGSSKAWSSSSLLFGLNDPYLWRKLLYTWKWFADPSSQFHLIHHRPASSWIPWMLEVMVSQEMMNIFDSIANSSRACLAFGGSLVSLSQLLDFISFSSTEQNSSVLVNACMAR